MTGSVSRGVGRPDLDQQPQQRIVRRRGPPEVAVPSSALPSANLFYIERVSGKPQNPLLPSAKE